MDLERLQRSTVSLLWMGQCKRIWANKFLGSNLKILNPNKIWMKFESNKVWNNQIMDLGLDYDLIF